VAHERYIERLIALIENHTQAQPGVARAQPQSASGTDDQPRVWILQATGAGDNRQLLNLTAALGWPYEVKQTLDALPWVLLDRIHKPGWRRLPARKHAELRPPWPDLVLISGGRGVIDALRVKAASGGRSRIVCLGRPWAPLAWFDRVITTPQYRLPDSPNVVQNRLPLNCPEPTRLAAAGQAWAPRLAHLPRPWLGLLLGGDSGTYRFTPAAARALGRRVDSYVRKRGGALLLTSSARTPHAALEALLGELSVPRYCHRWHVDHSENPLEAILALADRFVVTADSASMLAEACSTGRPVASFVPPLRWRARLQARVRSSGLQQRLGSLTSLRRRWVDQWVEKGLWFPARDMGHLHAILQGDGLIRSLSALDDGDRPDSPLPDDMERAVASIRALFPSLVDSPADPEASVGADFATLRST